MIKKSDLITANIISYFSNSRHLLSLSRCHAFAIVPTFHSSQFTIGVFSSSLFLSLSLSSHLSPKRSARRALSGKHTQRPCLRQTRDKQSTPPPSPSSATNTAGASTRRAPRSFAQSAVDVLSVTTVPVFVGHTLSLSLVRSVRFRGTLTIQHTQQTPHCTTNRKRAHNATAKRAPHRTILS